MFSPSKSTALVVLLLLAAPAFADGHKPEPKPSPPIVVERGHNNCKAGCVIGILAIGGAAGYGIRAAMDSKEKPIAMVTVEKRF